MYTPRRDPADRNPAHTRHARHNRTTRRGSSLVETLELRRLLAANWFDGVPGLWRTDGTAGGTNLLRPMKAADHFVELNGVTYFLGADDAGNSAGLWKTNGTNPGTSFVAPVSDLDSEPVVLSNSIYFLT